MEIPLLGLGGVKAIFSRNSSFFLTQSKAEYTLHQRLLQPPVRQMQAGGARPPLGADAQGAPGADEVRGKGRGDLGARAHLSAPRAPYKSSRVTMMCGV